jgi:hypothetical protein
MRIRIMDNESIAKVDELVEKLTGIVPEWKAREVGNNIMQAILDNFSFNQVQSKQFTEALISVLAKNKCESHDCGCPACPNSFYNYEAMVSQGFDVNREVKVEVKVEVPTTNSDTYVPSTTEIIWRKAAFAEFKKNSKYDAMAVPVLVSMVLTSRGAQPSNYSRMEAAFKNYLHTPDGEKFFSITRGRGGGVKIRNPWNQKELDEAGWNES